MLIRNAAIATPNGLEKADIAIEDGLFAIPRGNEACTIDAEGMLLIPGFIDTHIHGIGGAGTEDSSPEAILSMSRTLASIGTTSFFPTVYTDTAERMIADIRAIASAKGHEEGADIAGIHVEGPFISPHRIGAQNPAGRKDPDPAFFRRMIEEGKGLIKAMTCAPELPGIEEIAAIARENGIVLLDSDLNILEINGKAKELLGIRESDVRGQGIFHYFNPTDFVLAAADNKNIYNKKVFLERTSSWVELTIIVLKDNKGTYAVMKDITQETKSEEQLDKVKMETLATTDEVIKKQMRVAQEIASLLGETTAETKVALLKLKKTLQGDDNGGK